MSSRTHVFAVGIEEYQQAQIESADFAENDAREFVHAWMAVGADAGDCVSLLGSAATKTALESAFSNFLKRVTAEDMVVFFFAGNAISFTEAGFLLLHDTQPDDLRTTSIPLAAILNQIGDCKSSRILLFFDPIGTGIPKTESRGSGTCSTVELQRFCRSAPERFAFTACGAGESSWRSIKLKHGVWSSALLRALAGEAKDALAKGSLATTDSLRDYLSAEVPRLLRSTRSGNETQTPGCFGGSPQQFIVADLARLQAARAAETGALGSALKDTYLRGINSGTVRSLSGFRKGHRVPDRHFGAAEDFVRNVGHEKVQQRADAIFQDLRTGFGYRRKETIFACADGAATIKTPDFDVDLSIAQDPTDAGGYVLTVEIGNIRTPAVVLGQAFSDVFSRHCDTVVISLSRPLDLEDKIDELEGNPSLNGYLEYDPDGTSFTLKLVSPDITIKATKDEITLRLRDSQNLKTLLNTLQKALATLGSSGAPPLAADNQ